MKNSSRRLPKVPQARGRRRYHLCSPLLDVRLYASRARSPHLRELEVKDVSPDPLEILISPRAGQVAGAVQNPNTQQPAPQATVALVPQEKERRDRETYYRQTNTDASGRFTFKDLPPGQYKVFAWEDVESGAWVDPDFIKPVEDKGASVTLSESGQETVQVKLIPADVAPEKQNRQ